MIEIKLTFSTFGEAAAVLALLDDANRVDRPAFDEGLPTRARRGYSAEEAEVREAPGVKSNEKPPKVKAEPAAKPDVQAAIDKANADSAARREAGSAEAPAAFEYATLRAAVNKIGAAVAPDKARPALTKIATDLGAATFLQLTPEQWPVAYAACQELAAEWGVQL